MEKRTVEIILMLKGRSRIKPAATLKESLVRYLSHLYDCPEEYYTDNALWGIVREAVQDALSSCSNPGQIRAFMHNYFEARKWHDELEAFISALHLMQVREKGECINGFTKEVVNEILNPLYFERFEVVPDKRSGYIIWDHREDKPHTNICFLDGKFTEDPLSFASKEEAERGKIEFIKGMLF